jgi:hypothetical protein
MSPEQASGNSAQMGSKSDIYSLGVLLFELLTGNSLFEGDPESVIRQILVREPARPRSIKRTVPRNLETICLKAIEKDPARRYETAADLAVDLRNFASGLPILARRTNTLEQIGLLMRSHPTISAMLAIGTIVLATGGVAISSLRSQNHRLEGFRPVYVTTNPSGARVAVVPLDSSTNEPSADSTQILCPSSPTPLTFDAKSGRYLLEVELIGSDGPLFAEVYRTVGEKSGQSDASTRANIKAGLDPETCRLSTIDLTSLADATSHMVKIKIDEESRKLNPLLPNELYVDPHQTLPGDGDSSDTKLKGLLSTTSAGEPCLTYQAAVEWAERNHKRLASAAEYDAIAKAIKRGEVSQSIADLFDDHPEYTSTARVAPPVSGNAVANRLREMHVLKGYGDSTSFPEMIAWTDGSLLAPHDCKSAKIGIRGVLSSTPRFLIAR